MAKRYCKRYKLMEIYIGHIIGKGVEEGGWTLLFTNSTTWGRKESKSTLRNI